MNTPFDRFMDAIKPHLKVQLAGEPNHELAVLTAARLFVGELYQELKERLDVPTAK